MSAGSDFGPTPAVLILALAGVAALPLGWVFTHIAAHYGRGAKVSGLWMGVGALAVVGWVFGAGVHASTWPPASIIAVSLALGWTLLILAAVDIVALRLPDMFTLTLACAGLVLGGLGGAGLGERVLGAFGGFSVLVAIDLIYVRLRGRSGIGLGDAKLFAAAGAWLGVAALPSVLLLGAAGGLVWVAVAMLRRGRTAAAEPLPFGAPLCAAFLAIWLARSPL